MSATRASRGSVVFASIALYIVWGVTYLANRVAVADLQSFALAAARFVLAGALLYAWLRWRGVPAPSTPQWKAAALSGLFLCLGNAFVAWAVHLLPLGIAAVLVAMTPAFLVLFDWMRPEGRRPSPRVIAGLVLGIIGIGVLMSARNGTARSFNPLGALLILLGTIAWAGGSIYARNAARPDSPFMLTASQMLSGGLAITPIAIVLGQFRGVNPGQFSTAWWQAFAFLIFFGSIVGFSAYIYLLSHSSPATAGSYAFVNPAIAAVIGWLLYDERLGPRTFAAFAIIIVAVALIVSSTPAPPSRVPGQPCVDEPAAA
ncbi:MAG TPA: EamA family transporter [Gemmatimonadaceae bacterium]|nr:EamA family transporter [Gemmatimonadaceae bacterium]